MINQAKQSPLWEILSTNGMVYYEIPKYQREYSWNKDNWEALFSDIEENPVKYFIGSIIFVSKLNMPDEAVFEVIDGQQRLTTLSILYASIYQKLKSSFSEEISTNEDLQARLVTVKQRLVSPKDKTRVKLSLSTQNDNLWDWQSLLSEELKILEYKDINTKNKGNRRVYKCFRFFSEKIAELSLDNIWELLDKLDNIILVSIMVDTHSDAFVLFEVLNNRGVPLSAIDIIKNKMLSVLDKSWNIDSSFGQWQAFVRNISDNIALQERFLRHFYQAFRTYDRVGIAWESKATKSSLIRIYETLINRDAKWLMTSLIEKSKVYTEFSNPTEDGENRYAFIQDELIDLERVGAAPSYQLLLYISDNEARIQWEREIFYKALVQFLVSYFVRRNITTFPATSGLDQMFIEVIRELASAEVISFETIRSFMTKPSLFASDEDFVKFLKWDIYESSRDMTRFLLSKVEKQYSTKERNINFWEQNKWDYIWTIEHILPQGTNLPPEWVDMIANGDKQKAQEYQEQYAHTLWNLTLTGYNSTLSNAPFEIKRDKKNSDGSEVGYKNGLYLNNAVKNANKWGIDDISLRGERLIGEVLKMFEI